MSIEATIAAAVIEQLGPRLDALEEAIGERDGAHGPAPMLDRQALARWANCSVRTVDAWLAGGCPHVRLGGPGGSPRFVIGEVLEWLKTRD